MNTVTLMGRLSQEPETRYTQAGETVYNFNFAVNRRFIRSGGPEADSSTARPSARPARE